METSLYLILGIYTVYVLVKIYISFMNYGYIVQTRGETPVLLEGKKWVEAANYEIAKEKFSITSSYFDLFMFFIWIGFGLNFLDDVVMFEDNEILKSIYFIDLFVIVNYLLSLPFSVYEKFVIDKKFGFNNTTVQLFISLGE